jgi:N-acetylglucosamine-6-phosphate deacetylase
LPDIRVFQRLQAAAGGHIRLVTLAPELPGSADFIREVVGSGVQVAVGHTNVSLTGLEEYLETARAYFSTYVAVHFDLALPDLPDNLNAALNPAQAGLRA